MKIESLHIEGFGHFADQPFGPFDAPLTVVLGYNEAGKSTLLAFIRTILFGFPATKRAEFYPALKGGRHGGRITLKADDGVSYTVERIEDNKGVTLRITTGAGLQSADESLLQSLLGNSSKKVFEAVFALGLADLQDLKRLNEIDAAAQIYAAGMGATNLPTAIKAIESERDGLFLKGGKNQEAASILGRLGEIDENLKRVENNAAEYARLTKRRAELEQEIAEATAAHAAASNAVSEVERLQQAWEDWVTLGEAEEKLRQLPEQPAFPENAIPRLNAAELALREAELAKLEAREQCERTERLAKEPIPGESLLQHRDRIEAIHAGREAFDKSVVDLPGRRVVLDEQERDLEEKLTGLGRGWTEEQVESFETSIPVRASVNQSKQRLDDADIALRGATQTRDQRTELWTDSAAAEERARESLESMPNPPKTEAECQEALASLNVCRERLAAYLDVRGRRATAEALTRQSVSIPVGTPATRSPALPAGVLLAVGVVALGGGVVLGGSALLLGITLGLLLGAAGIALFLSGRTASDTTLAAPSTTSTDPYVEVLRAEEKQALEALRVAAKSFGLEDPTVADLDNEAAGIKRIEDGRRDLANVRNQWQEARDKRDHLGRGLESATRALEEAALKRKDGWDDWIRWLAVHGLPETLEPNGVINFFERIETIREKIRAAIKERHRIERIEEDIASYRLRVQPLATGYGIATELVDSAAVAAAADRLSRDLAEATEANTNRENALRAFGDAERNRSKLESQEADARGELERLLQAGKAPDGEQFRRNAAIHEDRAAALKEKATAESAIRKAAGGGENYPAFRSALAATGDVHLAEERDRLAHLFEEADSLRGKLREENVETRLKIDQLTNDEEASRLRGEHANLVEQLVDTAKRWATLAVARKLLEKAQLKYELEHQPAVLRSAEEFFGTVTGGRYVKLHSPLGRQEITAMAADGTTKTPTKLSRGTEDQLYLALRFGLIREFGQRATHLPVIVDDILVNFDPERAQRAANAFADLAKTNQVLVFTCHPGTVEMFQKASAAVQVLDLAAEGTQPRPGTTANGVSNI